LLKIGSRWAGLLLSFLSSLVQLPSCKLRSPFRLFTRVHFGFSFLSLTPPHNRLRLAGCALLEEVTPFLSISGTVTMGSLISAQALRSGAVRRARVPALFLSPHTPGFLFRYELFLAWVLALRQRQKKTPHSVSLVFSVGFLKEAVVLSSFFDPPSDPFFFSYRRRPWLPADRGTAVSTRL